MWERLRHRLEGRLAQMRAHPELILLMVLAYVGCILAVKETFEQLGAFGIVVFAATIVAAHLHRVHHRVRAVEPPPARSDEPMRALAVIEERDDHTSYRVRVPLPAPAARDVLRKAQGVFRSGAIGPADEMKAFRSDPYGLICLQDADGDAFGFVNFYTFEKNHFKLFLQGTYTFGDLLAGGMLAHPQARRAKVVYLASMLNLGFMLDSMRVERRRQNGILVWATVAAMLEHHIFPPDGIDIYSIGWDRREAAILRMFGLQPMNRVLRGQAEGRWIYSRRGVRRQDLEAIRARYEKRYGRWCSLDLEPLAATEPGVAQTAALRIAYRGPSDL